MFVRSCPCSVEAVCDCWRLPAFGRDFCPVRSSCWRLLEVSCHRHSSPLFLDWVFRQVFSSRFWDTTVPFPWHFFYSSAIALFLDVFAIKPFFKHTHIISLDQIFLHSQKMRGNRLSEQSSFEQAVPILKGLYAWTSIGLTALFEFIPLLSVKSPLIPWKTLIISFTLTFGCLQVSFSLLTDFILTCVCS